MSKQNVPYLHQNGPIQALDSTQMCLMTLTRMSECTKLPVFFSVLPLCHIAERSRIPHQILLNRRCLARSAILAADTFTPTALPPNHQENLPQ